MKKVAAGTREKVWRTRPCWAGVPLLLAVLVLACGVYAHTEDSLSAIVQSSQDVLTPAQRQWLGAQVRPIRIGVTSIPPQVLRDTESGALSGLCIDFIGEIERVLDCQFEVVYFDTWDAMMEAAFARGIDVIYAAQKTPSREEAFLFTEPYLDFENKIVTTLDIEGPLTLDGLADKTVAVVDGAAIEEYLKTHFPKIRLLSVDDELVGLMRVSFNQADAMVIEIARASWYIQQKKITNLHIAGNADYAYRLGFACRSDWLQLRGILDAGLAKISPERRNEMVRNWTQLYGKGFLDTRAVIAVLVGTASVMLAFFAWNWMLRRQVHRRTAEMEREIEAHQKDISILKRYETIISLSDDLMAFIDRDFVYRAVNDAYLKTLYKTHDQVIGHCGKEVIGEELFDGFLRPRLEEALTGKIVTYERWFDLEYAGRCYMQASYHPYKNTAGVIEGVVVVVHNDTERKLAEEELKDSEEKYRALIEQAVEMLFLHDLEGNLIEVNQAALQMTGYSREQLLHMKVDDIDPDSEMRQYKTHLWETLPPLASKQFEVRHRRKDGSVYWTEVRTSKLLLKGKPYIMAIAHDITEHKKAEEEREKLLKELRKNERRLSLAFSATTDAIWEWNLQTDKTYYSPRWYELLGYDNQQFPMDFETWKQLCHPDDLQPTLDRIGAFVREPKVAGYLVEFRMRKKDGSWAWIMGRGNVVEHDAEGRALLVSGTNTDITERKQAENALRESEERFQLLFNQAPMGYQSLDSGGNFIEVNQRWLDLLGYQRDEVIGKWFGDFLSPVYVDGFRKRFPIFKEKGEIHSEFEMVHKNGSLLFIAFEGKIGYNSNGDFKQTHCILQDITERKRSQEEREKLLKQLRSKNEELDSILFIASHDLKSPLVNIHGFAGELEKSVEAIKALLSDASISDTVRNKLAVLLNTDVPESLHFIKSGSQKMDALISGLLRLSRVGAADLNPTILDVDKLVRGIFNSMRFKIQEHNIDIATEGILPACRGDMVLITQVFANLIDNAIKYRHPARPCRIRIRGRQEDSYGIYQVQDNGIGIAPEQKDKVFELFHQLNPRAGGEGMGLTIVRRVLDRQNGSIQIDSEVGNGTIVSVTLPRA